MTIRCRTVLAVVLILTIGRTSMAIAQTSSDSDAAVTDALTARVETFFGYLKDPAVAANDAFDYLLADGPLENENEQIGTFVNRYEQLETSYGQFLVAKRVHAKRVGEDLMFLTFLYETERFPVVWRFAFYRPPLDSTDRVDWFLVRLSFDSNLQQFLELP